MAYVVAYYETFREYGGPEEGGWYYDCGNLIRQARAFPCEGTALAFCSKLNQKLKRQGFQDIRAKTYQGLPPMAYPDLRPYYE